MGQVPAELKEMNLGSGFVASCSVQQTRYMNLSHTGSQWLLGSECVHLWERHSFISLSFALDFGFDCPRQGKVGHSPKQRETEVYVLAFEFLRVQLLVV